MKSLVILHISCNYRIKSFLRGMQVLYSQFLRVMLDFLHFVVRVMPSRLTMPLHHLTGTSGLKSEAVTGRICQSLLHSCYDANSIYQRL